MSTFHNLKKNILNATNTFARNIQRTIFYISILTGGANNIFSSKSEVAFSTDSNIFYGNNI